MTRIIVDIPEATSGDFEIKVENTDFVAFETEPLADYTFLYKDGDRIMQDTHKEYAEHQPLWDGATGDVLIGGLGLGMVHQKLIDNPNVTSVTVVEKYQDVIDLVWDACPKDSSFTLIHDDITTWKITGNYNYVWIDTWLNQPHQPVDYTTYNENLIDKFEGNTTCIGLWPYGNICY
jgi:hypothetical protein